VTHIAALRAGHC